MFKLLTTTIAMAIISSSVYAVDYSQRDRVIKEARAIAGEITPQELNEMLEEGKDVIVLDIREIEQRFEGTIPTMDKYEVTRGQIEFKIMKMIPNKDAYIVTFCRGGPRGALAAKTLRELGYKNATNLKGGLKAWAKAGYPVKRECKPTF